MVMTDAEITWDYEHGRNKKQMIEVLADQNCVSKAEMAQYLAGLGYDVDKRLLPKQKIQKAEPDPVIIVEADMKEEKEQAKKFARSLDSVDVGKELPDQTMKADAGKPKLTLVPQQIIYAIAAIREYGNRKYPEGGPDNWKTVDPERYRDALFRHLLKYLDDPKGVDPESGLPHLWHLACNVAFLIELEGEQ